MKRTILQPVFFVVAHKYICKGWTERQILTQSMNLLVKFTLYTFLLFTNKQHAHMFLQYLNYQHVNITFTLECETNNALSFLYVKVSRENKKIITSVFRKETFSGQGTSIFSFCFHNFKLNSIKTLVIGPIILAVIIFYFI